MSTRKLETTSANVSYSGPKLLFMTDSRYENDWVSSPHIHAFSELCYIKKGKGFLEIENKRVPVSANTLVTMNAQISHTEISDKKEPLECYFLGVEGLHISGKKSDLYSVTGLNGDRDILPLFEKIYDELQRNDAFSSEIAQHTLEILILQLCRLSDLSYEIETTQKNNREMYIIKQFIDSNYQSKISLDDLAKKSSLSKYYMCHSFSKLYGISPANYITQVRIESCKDLLRTTDHSIEEIASMTGFRSRSYLAQCFRKATGMTAQAYRKTNT